MKLIVKNTGSLLLLFVVLAPFLFFAVSFCQQLWIQHEMMEKVEQESLTTVTVAHTDFSWVRDEEEVLIKGHLFDVHSYQQNGDTTSFTGLFDEDEDAIATNIRLYFEQKEAHGNQTANTRIGFLFLPFYQPLVNTKLQPCWKFITTINQSFTNKSLPELFIKISTPPPRPLV